VHRIDKDTSGLLVVAKSDAAHAGLAAQFAAHDIERAYWAVVWGVPKPPAGTIAGAIGRSTADRKKMALVRRGGKEAVTHYKVLKSFADAASLVECRLETGRTHQIRVHMTSIGHPLAGDQTYGRNRGGGAAPKAAALMRAFPRQALHAFLLGFVHPITNAHHLYRSGMPRDINELVAQLEAV
jgi:23S rRNA pseudouridine1911/1915/1917 synthase